MSPFEKFYSENWESFDIFNMSPKQRLRAAFEAGQASPNVITAYQLQARLAENIAAYDAETVTMLDQMDSLPSGRYLFSNFVRRGRNAQIQKYRDALGIIIDTIEAMEKELAEAPR